MRMIELKRHFIQGCPEFGDEVFVQPESITIMYRVGEHTFIGIGSYLSAEVVETPEEILKRAEGEL